MVIVVPVKANEGESSKIATLQDATMYAFIQLAEGMKIERITFKENFSNELFDYIVTPNKNDELDEAFDLGARALLAHPGMDLEEIVEALMFRELDEIM